MTVGLKYDNDKSRMGLVPPYALESVADVLTFGAQKYAVDNWKHVDNAHERYMDAALRHIIAYQKGEVYDTESNLPHLSHAICCLMFLLDLDLVAKKDTVDTDWTELQRSIDKMIRLELGV